jgi:hypothetical protein
MRIKQVLKNRVNKALALLTRNTYFDSIPLTRIANILEEYGLDGESMNGIYCGREGRATCLVADNSMIVLSWYKMEVTGQYEIVAYLS